ncbi:MAG: 16S rRNA (adenine(1518)-N(6)/adenine(1519)-N(6))-dimethyltransferase RsmA [Chloroflexi bacterium]|nr:16S rRNA (adenine(1518)-N(6)/adenine(1519)-N(6))-dimethyltransferase RsmA [Chloroflexota bacterium]
MHPKRILESLDIKARKGLGQNFLVERSVLSIIMEAAGLSSHHAAVEVGPGLGVLTKELAGQSGAVLAVELDRRLAAHLRREFAGAANLEIIEGDILKIEIGELLQRAATMLGSPPGVFPPYAVVANLPYYITSAVLRRFLEATHKPCRIVVMVQQEVAERIVARPPDMSLLSVAVQLYGEPRIVATLPPAAFYPPPKVHSAVVRIDVRPQPPMDVDPDPFFDLVQAGFSQRRKNLANSLSMGLGIEKRQVSAFLAGVGISPERRAQTLSVEDWITLFRHWGRAFGKGA